MESAWLYELPEELLYLWHSHRTVVLLSVAVLVGCVRLAVHWRARRTKVFLTPHLGSPVGEKKIALPLPVKDEVTIQGGEIVEAISARKARTIGPKRVTGVKKLKPRAQQANSLDDDIAIQPAIFYYSLGGSTRSYAEKLREDFIQVENPQFLNSTIHDLAEIDYDDFFVSPPKSDQPGHRHFYIILIPSYDISTELENFLEHLKETHHDFRIDSNPLSGLAGYTVFGFGDREGWPTQKQGYCAQATEVDKWMARLTGRKRAFPIGEGDVKSDVESRLHDWQQGVVAIMQDLVDGRGLGEGMPGSGEAVESGDEAESEAEDTQNPAGIRMALKRARTGDVEDLKAPVPIDFTTAASDTRPTERKPMVPTTSPTYSSLTKQGYTIVGTHSGVKICRWTKSALRGRGSCYKYSFYGIASHLCMEATPSLSCSNKCVFCWRHGTNPVSTTWRWTVDPPELVFAGMKEGHYRKIKMLRGVPGVRAERFQEAMRIRHCALSLVGEPIFYPYINQLLAMLHRERISSFLVCNAQHPDQLASLGPVTQLYVSIDASNKDSLRRIDRPLHRDFWERFLRCMDILREKRFTHRTVFRLTLVKGFNIEDEAEGYADLVARALPSFVEVKGVTYCGTSTAAGAGLSMQNVPFYEEVTAFVLALESALKRRGLDYGIGAEHAHSCCILLASTLR